MKGAYAVGSEADVLILVGSDSDLSTMEECTKVLKDFCVSYEITVASAHRTPERVRKLIQEFEKNGGQVLVAAAGGAAHLGGVMAAESTLPVIGVPVWTSNLQGVDSFVSMVQMPGGVPVATMSIGKAGAKNAGLFAVAILALKDARLARALKEYRSRMKKEIEEKAKNLAQ